MLYYEIIWHEGERMNFSEKVKYVRMKLELSQGDLAKAIGIFYFTISRWERENREPQIAMLGKFYNYCERQGIRFESEGGECKKTD